MFDAVFDDPDLFALVRQHCRENDVGVTIAAGLLDDRGDLRGDVVLVLKLDAFYDSRRMRDPPPSPDYLVVVRCEDGSYDGYVIELRDTGRTASVRSAVILKKFETALFDFLAVRYRHVFFDGNELRLKRLRLFLVTDPLGLRGRGLSDEEYGDRIRGTVLDAYGSLPPLEIGSHVCLIEPLVPDPTIHPC